MPTRTEALKVAVIGGGWFGQFHLDNLLKMEGVEIAAVATGNAERLAGLAHKAPGARAYADQRALLDGEQELDALIVCVPPDSHDGIEHLAAQRKVHLYMEKPLGVSLDEVRRCESAITASGIVCAVGYQTRYNPWLSEIKRYLEGRRVGAVVAKWMGVMPPTPWWRVKARSGGQLAEQVTHMVDALRFLFGEVESVYSRGRTGLIQGVPGYDTEDCSASVFAFEGGLLATVTCGCFVDGAKADSEIRFELYAEDGRAEFEWDRMARWGDRVSEQTARFGNAYHYPALKAFLDAVRTGNRSLLRSPYSDAVKTFEATFAANRSMETHRECFLSEL